MSVLPHPETLVQLAALRRADFHAEAEQSRRLRLARPAAARSLSWPAMPAPRGVAVALAVAVAALHRG
jgi:hypothetical protein